jgi:hypothetical protein
MQAADLLTLVAVGLVVLLVSLPCLRDFAVRENERDARHLLPRLAGLVGHPREPAGEVLGAAPGELDLEGLFAARPALVAGLPDARAGDDGRTLRHHGYVFAGLRATDGEGIALCAWPWDHGRTGELAYLFVPGRGLFEHPNTAGRWSGASGPRLDELGTPETSDASAESGDSVAEPASRGWSACAR